MACSTCGRRFCNGGCAVTQPKPLPGPRRLVLALLLLPLALLIAGCPPDKDPGETLISDSAARKDPNPPEPEPEHPFYVLFEGHYEDTPGGAHMDGKAGGAGSGLFAASPEIFDSLALRYPPGEVFTKASAPMGISLVSTLKATTPSIVSGKYKPKYFCSIKKYDAVTHRVIKVLRKEHSSNDPVNGIVCRAKLS